MAIIQEWAMESEVALKLEQAPVNKITLHGLYQDVKDMEVQIHKLLRIVETEKRLEDELAMYTDVSLTYLFHCFDIKSYVLLSL